MSSSSRWWGRKTWAGWVEWREDRDKATSFRKAGKLSHRFVKFIQLSASGQIQRNLQVRLD